MMKRSILKSVAVVAAFFIGVSINQSCGESDPGGTPSQEVMWNTIQALASEVAQLKQDVAALKAGGGSGGGSGNGSGEETLVDGLYFNRNGYVASKIKEMIYYAEDGSVTGTYNYTYDEYGRIKTYVSRSENIFSTQEYQYSGKDVTIINRSEYVDPNIENTITLSYRTTYY